MKNLGTYRSIFIALGLFAFCLFSKGQATAYSQQLWLQENALNPAASGLLNKYDAYVGYNRFNLQQDLFYGYYSPPNALFQSLAGQANVFVSKIKSGFGVTYNTKQTENWDDWYVYEDNPRTYKYDNLRFNYNYQIQFTRERVLSLGASYIFRKYSWANNKPGCITCDNYLEGNANQSAIGFGAMYKTSNWHVGLSASPSFVLAEKASPLVYFNYEFNAIAAATFDVGKNSTLTPYLYFSYPNDVSYTGYHYLIPTSALGIKLEHEWFLFGTDIAVGDFAFVNGTLGINLFKQFSLIYTAGICINDDASALNASYTFGLRYAFKK